MMLNILEDFNDIINSKEINSFVNILNDKSRILKLIIITKIKNFHKLDIRFISLIMLFFFFLKIFSIVILKIINQM